jgi:hypothetical protein
MPFQFTPTVSGTQLGRKTRLGCNVHDDWYVSWLEKKKYISRLLN